MDEKRKAFEAALAACKTALDVCEEVISIQITQGYAKGAPYTVSVLIDKDPDGLLKDVEPEEAETEVGGFYFRRKTMGSICVSSCNIRPNEEAYRKRHGLPPLPPMEGQEDKTEER